MDVLGECLFFDVGQGSANVILLQDGRAFVFDAGPAKVGVVHQFIEDWDVKSIECVVLSHNDNDHIKGWVEIAKRFGDKIKAIFLLQDRKLEEGDVLDVTMCLVEEGVIPRPKRAEVRDIKKSWTIWQDDTLNLRLVLLYPDFLANIEAQQEEDTNRTSVIAVFYCDEKCILFPGDSPMAAWKTLGAQTERLPIEVEILALPHHGGLLDETVNAADLRWLFTQAIQTRVATVSVGTYNQHNHPRREVIKALRDAGVCVMCTELTPRCHRHGSLRALHPGIIPPDAYSLVASFRARGRRRREPVGCAGTIIARLGAGDIDIPRRQEHEAAVCRKLASPMCHKADR